MKANDCRHCGANARAYISYDGYMLVNALCCKEIRSMFPLRLSEWNDKNPKTVAQEK